jgi:hypothetical protein
MSRHITLLDESLGAGELASLIGMPLHDNADCADLVLTADDWCALLERRRRVGWPLHFVVGLEADTRRGLEEDRSYLTRAFFNAEEAQCAEPKFPVQNDVIRHGCNVHTDAAPQATMKSLAFQGGMQ